MAAQGENAPGTIENEKGEFQGRATWPGTPPRMRNPDECAHGNYDPARHGDHCPDCGDYMRL